MRERAAKNDVEGKVLSTLPGRNGKECWLPDAPDQQPLGSACGVASWLDVYWMDLLLGGV